MVVQLVVIQYDDVAGADRAAARLLRTSDLAGTPAGAGVRVPGLVVIWWPSRATRPSFRQVECASRRGGVTPAFWGLFLGLVFYLPLVGAALGRTTGTVAGLLADLGIEDGFVNRMRDQIVPGTSSLALVCESADAIALRARLDASRSSTELLTRLDDRQHGALLTVFGR